MDSFLLSSSLLLLMSLLPLNLPLRDQLVDLLVDKEHESGSQHGLEHFGLQTTEPTRDAFLAEFFRKDGHDGRNRC